MMEMRLPSAMVVNFHSLLRTIAVMALACVCNGDHNVTYKIAVVSVVHLVLAQRNLIL
jgi:hypothetical protein